MEVRRVLIRTDGIKYLVIPKKSEIKEGELVLITNNLKLINKFLEKENGKRKKRSS